MAHEEEQASNRATLIPLGAHGRSWRPLLSPPPPRLLTSPRRLPRASLDLRPPRLGCGVYRRISHHQRGRRRIMDIPKTPMGMGRVATGASSQRTMPKGAATPGRVLTRSRARELGTEAPAADPGPVPPRKKKSRTSTQPEAGGSSTVAEAARVVRRPSLRFPPYPRSGKSSEILPWLREMRRIAQTPDPDGYTLPSTIRIEREASATALNVTNPADKKVVREAARSIVGISSCTSDEEDEEGFVHTGIVLSWNEVTKLATIVTCSDVACGIGGGSLVDPKLMLLVHLPNKSTVNGRLLFFNAHYRIALLEVLVDSPLQPATFGSSPVFGQEVYALARDDESSLMVRRAAILYKEAPYFETYKYWLSLSTEVALGGTGGPVIDEHGHVIGMAFGRSPNPDMLSIPILGKCIQMWTTFSRIARPVLDMDLKAFELLDVSHQEEIELEHNISDGFIVTMVRNNSTDERFGISVGDVIVSYNRRLDFTLHKFEAYLLSLGWDCLVSGSSWTVDLELEVYDPTKHTTRCITFPLRFSDISEQVFLHP